MTAENRIFKPESHRWFIIHTLRFSLIYSLGLIIARLFFSSQPFSIADLLLLLVGIVIMTAIVNYFFSKNTGNWKITISDDFVQGPGKYSIKDVRIPFRNLDREKSFKRAFFGKLLGYDYIRATDGKYIYIDSTFSHAQLEAIKAELQKMSNTSINTDRG